MKLVMTGLIAAALSVGFLPVPSADASNPTLVRKSNKDFCLLIVALCIPQQPAKPSK